MSRKGLQVSDIFEGRITGHELSIFSPEEISSIDIFEIGGRPYLQCVASDTKRPATPEEIVRQLFVRRLIARYGYPKDRIFVERAVYFGSAVAEKRADIVVSAKDDPDIAYIIIEVKKPTRRDGVEQLKSYCNAEGSPIGVWSNGAEIVILHREEPNVYRSLDDIPRVDQHLSDLIRERVTVDELKKRNKLVTERWTLKKVILDLEDLVLANAGVDAFEEVFKLIYAKLYDEWRASRNASNPYVEFRATGETHGELYDKIGRLFSSAKKQWPGVFLPGERIELTPAHLAICVSFLQDTMLFNTNLQIIDEAFEYLMTQVAKGAKGQYFTPRHVIDMAVKMLSPKWNEYMIDTAAGSCGFTVHTIFRVWGGELTAQGPTREQAEYASQMVYAIDFDGRSVKIAKAINLIAGDGKTNVYRLNSLDPRSWDEEGRVGLRPRLRRFPQDPAQDEWNQKNFRYFDFDVLMTNPPFAGDIKDTRILHQYDLASNDKGKWRTSLGRDVLFIERNLDFLRPGGRMATVLPEGRLNNSKDEYIRRFLSQHARILAVVSLHQNTFKPHSGTKTSLIFLQRWNDDPEAGPLCLHVDDYPIFFAVSQRGGKDNSGEYIYKKGPDGELIVDEHGHLVVDHDLDDIAEAFVDFAKKQAFSFWEED